MNIYVQNELAHKREEMEQLLANVPPGVPEQEVQQFQKTYENYLAELKTALPMQFVKHSMPWCTLQLVVRNEGTAPAHGVDIRVIFPRGAAIIKLDSIEDEVDIDATLPEEPSTPAWAKQSVPDWLQAIVSASQIARSLSGTIPQEHLFSFRTKRPYDSTTFPFGKHILHKKTEKVTHHRGWAFDPLAVYCPPSTQEGMTIAYEIVADELADPIAGELHVIWGESDPQG